MDAPIKSEHDVIATPRLQRAATAKAVSPFSGTLHISLRWNTAHFSIPTA